jgi:hypothetical protein
MNQEINKINDGIERWVSYLVADLKKRMVRLKIYVTGDLEHSIKTALEKGSDGDINKIFLNFLMYGRLLDMGVRNGVGLADVNTHQYVWRALGVRASGAKAKRWYSPVISGELKDLSKYMAIAYAGASSVAILEPLADMNELNINL